VNFRDVFWTHHLHSRRRTDMQRPETRKPRHGAERDAAQPIAGQPRNDDDSDELEQPEEKPSFLTARELQARQPSKAAPAGGDAGGEGDGAEDSEELPAKGAKKRSTR
jgi:hypothetical protein